MLQSFVSDPRDNASFWTDFVAVFVKSEAQTAALPRRITDGFKDFSNGVVLAVGAFFNDSELS
jgi:hypothetical protein